MLPPRLLALLVSSLVALATVAQASEDGQVYPGSMCHPARSGNAVVRDAVGRIINRAGFTITIVCPAINDAMTTNGIEHASIIVLGPVVSCHLHTRSPTGTQHVLEGQSSGIPLQNGVGKLNYGDGDRNVSERSSEGYIYFTCDIPEGSGIISYQLVENENES